MCHSIVSHFRPFDLLNIVNLLRLFQLMRIIVAFLLACLVHTLAPGSQFKVESIMIRLARPLGYVFISPSRDQVKTQRAPEAVPLILEPISHFNTDPVVVLDFQSLYPSIIIAYNNCFSTSLGKVSCE